MAVCAGLLGGTAVADTIGNSFSSAKVHFWILAAGTLIFGAIGFFVAEMLIEKNFRVFHKKRVGEWAVLTVVLAAFLGALKLDLFRIEGKIPDVSEVKVVSLNLDYTLRYTAVSYTHLSLPCGICNYILKSHTPAVPNTHLPVFHRQFPHFSY